MEMKDKIRAPGPMCVMIAEDNDAVINRIRGYLAQKPGALVVTIEKSELNAEETSRRMKPKAYETNEGQNELLNALVNGLGLSDRVKGTGYLMSAILIARNLGDVSGRITKEIYPDVARMYDASSTQVERAIRSAIDSAWKRGGMRNCGMFLRSNRPTNGEVIQMFTERVPKTVGDESILSRSTEEALPKGDVPAIMNAYHSGVPGAPIKERMG